MSFTLPKQFQRSRFLVLFLRGKKTLSYTRRTSVAMLDANAQTSVTSHVTRFLF